MGVDLAEPTIAIARERHAADNRCFVAGDALSLNLPPADLIFSRHGVMFFADSRAVFANLRHHVVSGAPLVFSCFDAHEDNLWATELAHAFALPAPGRTSHAPGPFAFADRAYRRRRARPGGLAGVLRQADELQLCRERRRER